MFPVVELYYIYGPSLLAAAVGSATVIWQTKTSSSETNQAIAEHREQTNMIEKKLDYANDNILAVTQEVTTAMQTRDLRGMYASVARIKACRESGGGEC